MDEADSATKALGLVEPPIGMPTVDGSDTESEAEVATMSVMAETGNIDMGAEVLPNPDEAEAAFEGKAVFSRAAGCRPLAASHWPSGTPLNTTEKLQNIKEQIQMNIPTTETLASLHVCR